jgi:hypothetical protein
MLLCMQTVTVNADIISFARLVHWCMSHLPHDFHAHNFLPHLDLGPSILTLLVVHDATRGYQLVTLQHTTSPVDAGKWFLTHSPVGPAAWCAIAAAARVNPGLGQAQVLHLRQHKRTTDTRPVFAALPSGDISAIVMTPVSLFCSSTSPRGFLMEML